MNRDTAFVHRQSNARAERPLTAPDKEGLDALLASLGPALGAARSLSGKLEVLITLDGRSPLELGLAGLTPWQHAVYTVARQRRHVADESSGLELALGVRANGRVVLSPVAAVVPGDFVFATAWLNESEQLALEAALLRTQSAEAPRAVEMEHDICAWSEVVAQNKARRLAEALDHVDPIVVHLHGESFSNVPHDNNLLKSRGAEDGDQYVLSRLPTLPLAEWSSAQRAFVYCFDLLLEAGFRGEEFNSQYLTPARLNAFFDRVIASYCAAVPSLAPPAATAPMAAKAAFIKRGRVAMTVDHIAYRWVHGITLYKEQRFFPKQALGEITPQTLPAKAQEFVAELGLAGEYRTCYDLFRDLVQLSVADTAPGLLGLHPLEALVVLLVDAATEELASDIGMTRGLRRWSELARVHDADAAEEANAWSQAAYFCAVVPASHLRKRGVASKRGMRNVLKAISARMRFNSWHYMPGHFERARCAPDRHFYLPPAMSDTAEWSDQRHRGHVAAEVRYSMRAPAPLFYRGKRYPGMLDLRLMRRAGTPYTLTDLKRANEYLAVLQQLYQAVLDVTVEGGPGFSFDGFSNDWFEKVRWEDVP
jgi:hypothetical protein